METKSARKRKFEDDSKTTFEPNIDVEEINSEQTTIISGDTKSIDTNENKRTKSFFCVECNKLFSTKQHLTTHMLVHTREKPFQCPECKKHFSLQTNMKKHMMVHTGEKPFSCDECGKKFRENGDLKKHKRTHTGEKPFECPHCDVKCSISGNLKSHMRVHTKEQPFSCLECDSKFAHKAALVVHMRTHNGDRPYSCDKCGKKFSQNGALATHMRIHTGEKPYSCDRCDQKFSSLSSMIMHIRIHHTHEKPYTCQHCEMKFSTSRSLVTHTRVHTGEKPFKCDQCGAKFTQKFHMKDHIRRIHTETGQKRQKKKQQRFFRELEKQHKIQFNIDTEREVSIDFKCAGQGGNLARLDGAKVREKDLYEVMVDLDENQHKHYPISCECKRTEGVAQSLMIARPDGKRFHIRINPDAFKVDGKTQRTKYQDRLIKFADVFHNFVLPEGLFLLSISFTSRKGLWDHLHVL